MNTDILISQLNGQVSRTANDVQATLATLDVNNDPQAMLKAQYAMQQYSVMIGYESAIMKSVKDMMMGIISKIG